MVLIRASAFAPRVPGWRSVVAAFAALGALLPGPAGAVAPPRPDRLAVLGARCDSAGFVRLETRRSSRVTGRLRLEADAVVLPGVRRAALIELGEPPEKRDTRIPWAEVERLSLGRSRTREGLVLGGLVGAALGAALVGRHGPDGFEPGDHFVLALAAASTLGCAGIGALVGAANPRWTPLYP